MKKLAEYMSSRKQLDANRRNGSLSNGPKTPEGKAAASKNAIKHGLLSRKIVLMHEHSADLAELGEQLSQALSPVGELECVLVDRIIELVWRLRRLGQIETGILEYWKRSAQSKGVDYTSDYGLAFVSDSCNRSSLSNLSRYESQMERNLLRCMHELQRLQAARKGQHVSPPQAIDIDVTGVPEPSSAGDERE
jgi:hypothetical protein